jgi:hypothetical protein
MLWSAGDTPPPLQSQQPLRIALVAQLAFGLGAGEVVHHRRLSRLREAAAHLAARRCGRPPRRTERAASAASKQQLPAEAGVKDATKAQGALSISLGHCEVR